MRSAVNGTPSRWSASPTGSERAGGDPVRLEPGGLDPGRVLPQDEREVVTDHDRHLVAERGVVLGGSVEQDRGHELGLVMRKISLTTV
jgi:hypothetical protein